MKPKEEVTAEEDVEDVEGLRKACISCGACEKYHPFVATPAALKLFREALLRWFCSHRRRLPWRGDIPPYTSWSATRSATAGSAAAAAAAGDASSLLPVGQQLSRKKKKQDLLKGQTSLISFLRVKSQDGRQRANASCLSSPRLLTNVISPASQPLPAVRSNLADSAASVVTTVDAHVSASAAASNFTDEAVAAAPCSATAVGDAGDTDGAADTCGCPNDGSNRNVVAEYSSCTGNSSTGNDSVIVDGSSGCGCKRSRRDSVVESCCRCCSCSSPSPSSKSSSSSNSACSSTAVGSEMTTIACCCHSETSQQQQQQRHEIIPQSLSRPKKERLTAVEGSSRCCRNETVLTTQMRSAAETGDATISTRAATRADAWEGTCMKAEETKPGRGGVSRTDDSVGCQTAERNKCFRRSQARTIHSEAKASDYLNEKPSVPSLAPEVTPYGVWVSEVMLQQTQVSVVIDYWLRWMRRWPSVETLAAAGEEEVQHMWSGLGYYRRARQLLHGAQVVVNTYGKQLPVATEELLKIPGIGPYTAGAIRAFAYNLRSAAVDGNILRVISRLAGFAAPANDRRLATAATLMMPLLLHRQKVAESAEALIELGATVCSPRNPACAFCPVKNFCRTRGEAEKLLERDTLHSIDCTICASTAKGATSPVDYPLQKNSMKGNNPEEIYATLLVVAREMPLHADDQKKVICRSRTHWISNNSSSNTSAVGKNLTEKEDTSTRHVKKRCSSKPRQRGECKGIRKQVATETLSVGSRLTCERELQGRKRHHQEKLNFMLLLRRRPSTGLLAGQLEAPSCLLSRSDAAGAGQRLQSSNIAATDTGLGQNASVAPQDDDDGDDDDDRLQRISIARQDAGKDLSSVIAAVTGAATCTETNSCERSLLSKADIVESDRKDADERFAAAPLLHSENNGSTVCKRNRRGCNQTSLLMQQRTRPRVSVESLSAQVNPRCRAEQATAAGGGESKVRIFTEGCGDKEKNRVASALLNDPTTAQVLSELWRQLNIYATASPKMQYAGHVRHVFSHVTHILLVFVCEADLLSLEHRNSDKRNGVTTPGAKTNNESQIYSFEAARAACNCAYTQKVLDVFEDFCTRKSATTA